MFSGTKLDRIGIAEVFCAGRVLPLEGKIYQILLAVTQFFQLGQLCVCSRFVRIPLDQEEVLFLHPVVQPLAVGTQPIVQMIHLFAVRQAKAFFG